MIEFDMPGHAGSWCAGYPEICPSTECTQPLDPSNDLTFTLIDSLLSECTGRTPGGGLFPYSFLHLGGDEVEYWCWVESEHIQAWEKENGFSGSEDTYEYFVNKAAEIARNQSRTPVQWVEVFEHFGDKLDHNTVVHVWKEKSTMDAVLQAGYRTLLSDNDRWYLDWLTVTWDMMYNNEPTEGLSADSDTSLILGGNICGRPFL
jgi:hexosaminidase